MLQLWKSSHFLLSTSCYCWAQHCRAWNTPWASWISCPGSVTSHLLGHPKPTCWWAAWDTEGLGTVWALLINSWNSAVLLTVFCSKMQNIAACELLWWELTILTKISPEQNVSLTSVGMHQASKRPVFARNWDCCMIIKMSYGFIAVESRLMRKSGKSLSCWNGASTCIFYLYLYTLVTSSRS